MKLLILLALISCGKNEPLDALKDGSHLFVEKTGDMLESVGRAPRIVANKLLGTSEDSDENIADNSDKIDDNSNTNEDNSDKIDENTKKIAENEAKIDDLYDLLDGLYLQLEYTDSSVEVLQSLIVANQVRLAGLESNKSVSKIIDPCGDFPNNYDEVILQLSSGEFIAYFESRGKRFLSIIEDGNFTTTDRQRCRFTILDGELTWNIQ